ncbi:MAG: MBL fold metallo-hydrolase, partial [Candidatus Omnitrophica bacterium]|nr:MBL fold metallo-hydrolase [Candidatus Omnitrophota bacterium]
MKIQFLGAAQNVTGSRFILETKCSRILIDCGLYQERELRNRNWEKFPVNPTSINSIILTHAHIDHCGYLPKIVKEGFTGRIFCTTPTAKITEISLLDSAKIQKRDAILKIKRHIRDKKYSSYPVKPLYNIANAKKVFTLFV